LNDDPAARSARPRSFLDDQMSLPRKRNKEPNAQSPAPVELRVLARLELKKRLLLAELAEVESHHRQLSREIELKGIPIPWLDTV
jgi:hypothetical protein